jgi:hypothetical protein
MERKDDLIFLGLCDNDLTMISELLKDILIPLLDKNDSSKFCELIKQTMIEVQDENTLIVFYPPDINHFIQNTKFLEIKSKCKIDTELFLYFQYNSSIFVLTNMVLYIRESGKKGTEVLVSVGFKSSRDILINVNFFRLNKEIVFRWDRKTDTMIYNKDGVEVIEYLRRSDVKNKKNK